MRTEHHLKVRLLKKKIKIYIQTTILPYILSLFVRFIYLTSKKVFHYRATAPSEPFILAMWHGELLMQPLNYRNFAPNKDIKVIVSQHRDGETIRKTVEFLGVGSISGSSTRGGAKALIGAIKTLKNNINVAITPDGPKGPIYSIANGIVAIAQKADVKIIVCRIKATKYWQFNSWDRFIVPKPFGRIDFYMSQPFDVANMQIEDAKAKIKQKFDEVLI